MDRTEEYKVHLAGFEEDIQRDLVDLLVPRLSGAGRFKEDVAGRRERARRAGLAGSRKRWPRD